MKYDIAGTYADVQVLLDVLRGEHRQARSDRRGNLIAGVFFGGVTLAAAAFGDWAEAALLRAVFVLIGLAFPVGMWIAGLTRYVFTDRTIEQRNPLWRSWTVATGDVHRVAVEFANQWILIITTNTDRVRRIPVVESMSVALGTLYPEVFGPSRPAILPKRLGYVMYTILALVIVAFVTLVIVLIRKGLFVWR